MSTLWQNLNQKILGSRSKLHLLIGINVGVYLLVNVFSTLERFIFQSDSIGQYSQEYLLLPSYLPKLLIRFWTPVTYMFMHAGVFHILFNMLWLYWMGQIFQEYLGNKRIIGVYLMGGLAGAFLFVVSYNLFPFFTQSGLNVRSVVVGASASVMAIIVATATLLPDYTISLMFIGPVKLKWIAIFYVVIDFFGIVGLNAGGEIAHLGGAAFGYIYIKQLQKGNDWTKIGKIFSPKPKLKVAAKNYEKRSAGLPRQEEIDRILDKISQSGYSSLSKVEKEILFRASNDEGKK
jgi:membrane associated rhomboid family serine protease